MPIVARPDGSMTSGLTVHNRSVMYENAVFLGLSESAGLGHREAEVTYPASARGAAPF
jgi:hypothetical protein